MKLNDIKPGRGARPAGRRLGRGLGSGRGKTCGRGHKGQKARSGSGPPIGYEGGQMPLQRRMPKFGFASRKARFSDQIRLDQLSRIEAESVDLEGLKAAGLIGHRIKRVKIIASGAINRAIVVKGLVPTKSARVAIEAAGGRIED